MDFKKGWYSVWFIIGVIVAFAGITMAVTSSCSTEQLMALPVMAGGIGIFVTCYNELNGG